MKEGSEIWTSSPPIPVRRRLPARSIQVGLNRPPAGGKQGTPPPRSAEVLGSTMVSRNWRVRDALGIGFFLKYAVDEQWIRHPYNPFGMWWEFCDGGGELCAPYVPDWTSALLLWVWGALYLQVYAANPIYGSCPMGSHIVVLIVSTVGLHFLSVGLRSLGG